MVQGIVKGQNLFIKSVQSGRITVTGTSNTATINAVVTANSVVFQLGINTDTGEEQPDSTFSFLALTNTTTVTATRDESPGDMTISFMVIEYHGGVIKSKQDGSIAIGNIDTYEETAINAVDLNKTILYHRGHESNEAGGATWNQLFELIFLKDATTIRAEITDDHGSNSSIYFTVLEFY